MTNKINLSRRCFLRNAAMTIASSQFGTIAFANARLGASSTLSSLTGATTWLNSQPLAAADLQGKPVSDRQFDIEFLDAAVEAFSFTFG